MSTYKNQKIFFVVLYIFIYINIRPGCVVVHVVAYAYGPGVRDEARLGACVYVCRRARMYALATMYELKHYTMGS